MFAVLIVFSVFVLAQAEPFDHACFSGLTIDASEAQQISSMSFILLTGERQSSGDPLTISFLPGNISLPSGLAAVLLIDKK